MTSESKCPKCGYTMDKVKVHSGFIKEQYVWACRHCRTIVSKSHALTDTEHEQPE